MKKVIFIAGTYGVGKSTICDKLSLVSSIPHFSSSDLISHYIGEVYGSNKLVKDINNNQDALIFAINKILEKETQILLSGHFCIINKNNKVERLPEFVYKKLNIGKVLLLEADEDMIITHLYKRDNIMYDKNLILKLQKNEKRYAKYIASKINVPIYLHHMKFNNEDINNIIQYINV